MTCEVQEAEIKYVVCRNPDRKGNTNPSAPWDPGKLYAFHAAVSRAKEFARMYPAAEFFVCKVVGRASIQDVVYTEVP